MCSKHYFQGLTQMNSFSWEVGTNIISILQLRKQAQWHLLTCSKSHSSWLVEPAVKTQVVWAQKIPCDMIFGGAESSKTSKTKQIIFNDTKPCGKMKNKSKWRMNVEFKTVVPHGGGGLWSQRSRWKLQKQWSFLKTEWAPIFELFYCSLYLMHSLWLLFRF